MNQMWMDLGLSTLQVVGSSALAAAVIPPKWLGPANWLLQFAAANFGRARNAS